MDCSMPGLSVHHQLPEFTQTHVHWISDAIQPSHPLLFPSSPAFNLSQNQGLKIPKPFFLFLFPCQSKQNTLPYRKSCPFHNYKNIPFFQRREGRFHKQKARTFLIIEFEHHFPVLKTCTKVPNGTQNVCNCTQRITLKSITNQTHRMFLSG